MNQEKKPGLFEEFPAVSAEAWEEKIHEDLKGADYEKRLVWKTDDGLSVMPYYRAEHLDDLPHTGIFPGEAPYVRGKAIKRNDWITRQDFPEPDPAKANAQARKAIGKGAEAVGLNAREADTPDTLKTLLDGIDPKDAGIHFIHAKKYPALAKELVNLTDGKTLKGSFNFDPLGYFLLYGKHYESRDASFEATKNIINIGKEKLPHYHVLNINGRHYHNAGASVVQELAFALSQANEYLANLTDAGLSVEDICPRMQFTFGVGSAYFLEIAKFRAVKMLWAKIVEHYTGEDTGAGKMTLHVETSHWNKTIYDPYVNMLRTTTEAMAASIAGADSITVKPFDDCFRKPDAFSLRMARNQQTILKYEAYFNKVADPAAGSYYVENLTHSIAKAAWELFLETEDKGGFLEAVSSGFIRSSIESTCQKRDMDIAMRKRVFVGTNQYANPEERMLDKVEPTAKLSDISGLRPYRGAQPFEALRMAVENHAQKGFEIPTVFMFTYGNPVMRKARATFSGNFFGVAGYHIIDNLGFPDIESGVKAALEAKAHIVVLCSSDDEYPDMAPAASEIKKKAPNTQVVVAGNPKAHIDTLREAGVEDFIHIRTNALETLTRYNEFMEIV
ncbi:MAG: methylmalonyl-CoA mutase family protein [Bacteroidales bacterium]